jgi:hypothetical protein
MADAKRWAWAAGRTYRSRMQEPPPPCPHNAKRRTMPDRSAKAGTPRDHEGLGARSSRARISKLNGGKGKAVRHTGRRRAGVVGCERRADPYPLTRPLAQPERRWVWPFPQRFWVKAHTKSDWRMAPEISSILARPRRGHPGRRQIASVVCSRLRGSGFGIC